MRARKYIGAYLAAMGGARGDLYWVGSARTQRKYVRRFAKDLNGWDWSWTRNGMWNITAAEKD